jgi:histidinol-phosphatase
MNPTELKDLLDFAIQLGKKAGELSLSRFRGSFAVDRKADGTLVTSVDHEVEILLQRYILEAFPQDSVIGEEQASWQGSSSRRWIIDPIDGTYSFVHGIPLYGVLVGMESFGEAVLGVVNLPALGEIVYAARDLGCFWNGTQTQTSTVSALDQALLLATDFGFPSDNGFSNLTKQLEPLVEARRTWGDCYGHVLVATGRAEIMLDPVVDISDCAALLPIIEEAGGHFTDGAGLRSIYGPNAISSNGPLHCELTKVIANLSRTVP